MMTVMRVNEMDVRVRDVNDGHFELVTWLGILFIITSQRPCRVGLEDDDAGERREVEKFVAHVLFPLSLPL